jgi:hypothetical protein
MSERNQWRYMFVRYEINYLTQEEYIYANGKLTKQRDIDGNFLALLHSELLLEYVNDLGEDGWELKSESRISESKVSESRVFTFKQLVINPEDEEDEDEDENENLTESNKGELKNLNTQFSQFKFKTTSTLAAIEESLVEIQAKLERISQDELISTKGINYRHLRNLLSIGNWREADKETCRILLKAFHEEELEWLSERNIKQIPNEDLLIINRLWMQHSNGRFSYSTQSDCLMIYPQN